MHPFPGNLLAQSKQRQNYEYDDNQSDEINYSMHGEILSCAMSVRSNAVTDQMRARGKGSV
jgi:hypothetical protein